MSKKDQKPQRATSLKAAASMLNVPAAWVSKAKEAGVPAFTANGTIDVDMVREWIDKNSEALESTVEELSLKDQKLAEQVRQLRIRNDRDAGKLIARSWVIERHSRLSGEINGVRSKSEAEDALLFAGTNGDIALCRSILRGIWDRIMLAHQDASKHFEE